MSRQILEMPMSRPAVANRGHRERDRDAAAVPGDSLGLEVLDRLAAADPREDLVSLVQPIGRNDRG
jgi:hypothetical protein